MVMFWPIVSVMVFPIVAVCVFALMSSSTHNSLAVAISIIEGSGGVGE